MRFPGENVTRLSMNQLRGREGARVRKAYRDASKATGVPWARRAYNPRNFDDSDPINQALSVANSCLYGICHAAIHAFGLSPALGFIHTGDRHSLIYDIADLYKAEISIPVAFDVVASGATPIERTTRHACRNEFRNSNLLERISADLNSIFSGPDDTVDEIADDFEWHTIHLWDPEGGTAPGGINYGEEPEP